MGEHRGEEQPNEFDTWKAFLGQQVEVYLGADGQKRGSFLAVAWFLLRRGG